MKITGGIACGRSINIPAHPSVRPTGAKMREALFNILGLRIVDAHFLDLFAGSGLIGFEALSRGASSLISVEKNHICIRCIESNAEKLGYKDNLKIIRADFRKAINSFSPGHFNIIFADPPYKSNYGPQILELIGQKKLLKPGGILVIEHDNTIILNSNNSNNVDLKSNNVDLKLIECRPYGQSAFSFFS